MFDPGSTSQHTHSSPHAIEVRGARVHNLRGIDVDVPLGQVVAVAGVSGSGKSSLALGVLYAEGARRYLESLSTYTRRRLTQAARPDVDEVRHVPAALALHQRPPVPGVRSTFGTSTELLSSLRLAFSRLGQHVCPNGHLNPPSPKVALEEPLTCTTCGASFPGPGAEALAFNSGGACPRCEGTGQVRQIDESTLVPDTSLTLREGAVRPWGIFGIGWMWHMAEVLGVRVDVPFRDLTESERETVLHGPAVTRQVAIPSRTGKLFDLNATYRNAVEAVREAMSNATSEKGLERLNRFLTVRTCPDCQGTRLSAPVRAIRLASAASAPSTLFSPASAGRTADPGPSRPRADAAGASAPEPGSASGSVLGLAEACTLPLADLVEWVAGVPAAAPDELAAMATQIVDELTTTAARLLDLGLGYLSLDRASMTLSTGERQRVQLARAVRNRATGVLYVLDEPSIGLHPANVDGLLAVMADLVTDGNSVLVVDHDVQLLRAADHLIEIGPGSGTDGGRLVTSAPVPHLLGRAASRDDDAASPSGSRILPFLTGQAPVLVREQAGAGAPTPEQAREEVFAHGAITLETAPIHTVQALGVQVPQRRLTAVTGVSGSGKTTLVLEALVPALQSLETSQPGQPDQPLPHPVTSLDPGDTRRAVVVDASPIGANVRSTVATYSGVMDLLRRTFARLPAAKAAGLKVGDFSYNTGSLRCPHCDGTGQVVLDVQFLPDVEIECPTCHGSRFSEQAGAVRRPLPASCSLTGVSAAVSGASARAGSDDAPGVASSGVATVAGNHRTDSAGSISLPELLGLTVHQALQACADLPQVARRLRLLEDLGLGYLTLGEATPALSGGEAQRLKLSTYLGSSQEGALFVLDEPSIGLHPLDVRVLLRVLDRLVEDGASVLVIEHDLDMIANADWVIDMGPGGGAAGGRVVAKATPSDLAAQAAAGTLDSVTGRYLAAHLAAGGQHR